MPISRRPAFLHIDSKEFNAKYALCKHSNQTLDYTTKGIKFLKSKSEDIVVRIDRIEASVYIFSDPSTQVPPMHPEGRG